MSREAPKIGLDSVYIAKVVSDTADGIVYDTPIALKGGVNISINPNSSIDTDFADNGAFVTINNRGKVDAAVELIDVDNAIISQMLGQSYANGIVTEKALDQSPYFAMMFRVLVATEDSTPVYHLFCYAKGRFSVPETTADTRKDTINFGHTTLNATFINTQYDSKIICSHCRTDDPTVPSDIITNWFTTPTLTSETSNVTVNATLKTGSTSSEGNIEFSVTGSSAVFNILESSVINRQSIIFLDENGASLGVNLSFDTIPSATPKIHYLKYSQSNAIKTIVITNSIRTSQGGTVFSRSFVLNN